MRHPQLAAATLSGALLACGARTELDIVLDASVDLQEPPEASPPPKADAPESVGCVPGPATTLVSGPISGGLALDVAFAYYRDEHGLWRVPKKGGPASFVGTTQITGGPLLDTFGLDSTYAYYGAPDTALVRVPKQGGTPQPLGLKVDTLLMTFDDTDIYTWPWEGAPTLYRLSTQGGAPTLITSALPPLTNSVVIDGPTAYVGAAQSGLFTLTLSDGTLQQTSAITAWNLAIDATDVYFTTGDNGAVGPNAIVRIPKEGGLATVVTKAEYAFGIALDGDQIYYADEFEGTVRRIAKTGGPTVVIYSFPQDFPSAVAVDETCVYWASGGGIWVAGKPP